MVMESTPAKLGAALRSLRKKNGWTLSDVAGRTGIPVSTLSKVENDKLSLTYDKLARLSEGLHVDIAQLFSPEIASMDAPRAAGRRSIQRRDRGDVIETKNYGHWYPASDLLHKKLVPIIAELHARTLEQFGPLVRHPGEEYAIVLEGACELHTELYAPLRMEQGDSIYFDATMGHAYLAAAEGRCVILSVCSAPEAQLLESFPPSHGEAATDEPAQRRAAKPVPAATVARQAPRQPSSRSGSATRGK
jgi:transcriptional regulator with XRE-family HTH domain